MDFSTTTDNELALMLQVAATQRDLLNEAVSRRQAEIAVASNEMKELQARAKALMVEQEKREAAKKDAPADAGKPA